MHKLNGLDLVDRLRKHKIYIPFIFVTAHNEFILEALRKQAIDYLLKPVNIRILRQTIDCFRSIYSEQREVKIRQKAERIQGEILRINPCTRISGTL